MIRTILIFTILYTILYWFADNPMQFESEIDPLYFAVTLSSSVGFGDYTPKTTFSKIIVILHMCALIFDIADIVYRITKVRIY